MIAPCNKILIPISIQTNMICANRVSYVQSNLDKDPIKNIIWVS